MRYQFPSDLSVEEVRSTIIQHNQTLETPAFLESDRGDHLVFHYIVTMLNSFPHPNTGDAETDRRYAILRECRGLVMSKNNGTTLARRYPKFFNVNEKEFTQAHVIPWHEDHWLLDKLDGSMITPFTTDRRGPDDMAWGTKKGETDVSKPVVDFVDARPNYRRFAQAMIGQGATPIFEWCSRKQKIIIDYPSDRLVLTGVRTMDTGTLMAYPDMVETAGRFDVEVVRAREGRVSDVASFLEDIGACVGEEGVIVRWSDGHMVKVKGRWYTLIHRSKELLQFEKDVWALILDGNRDDLTAMMDQEDRARVQEFRAAFEAKAIERGRVLAEKVEEARHRLCGDKKRFAAEMATYHNPMERTVMFAIWDGASPFDTIERLVGKYTHTSTRINMVRPLLGGLSWDDYRDHTSAVSDD